MSDEIRKHWPSFLLEIMDFVYLAATEEQEIKHAQSALNRLLDNQYVMTACNDGIQRREELLNIQANPSMETTQFRRQRIINRYQMHSPFTVRFLQHQLDELVGTGRTFVALDVPAYTMTITTRIDDAPLFREVEHTVQTIKPANVVYRQHTAIADSVYIAEHISKSEITWNYKLDGTWKLADKPFATLGQEVAVT